MFSKAAAFINHTGCNLFLTGKAGTGKTTFLHYIKENSTKKLAVVAPTGVAAINAGGSTIHSFFLLPWGMFLPSNTMLADVSELDIQVFTRPQLKAKLNRFNRQRLALLRELELLIIDEVSMVRADMMDTIDFVLKTVRHNHSQPFGGVQMLFIGDMMQLPPVLKEREEYLLRPYYNGPFFFDAQVIRNNPPLYIELTKVFRQSNENFVELLNKVRNNALTDADFHYLNSFYRHNFKPAKEDEYITLTSHNYLADRINDTELENLSEKLHVFEAAIGRNFPESMYPTDKTLYLKKGAQIMFVKNDKGEDRRYYNGKIGVIDDFLDDEIQILFRNEDKPLLLKREKWKNVKYTYNNDNDSIDEEELGTFSQYPIRLAWAITIHKSQGLTFERAIIDAGESFASGQVYVALSRLRSLEGLVLRSRIYPSSISTNAKVVNFSQQERNEAELPTLLEQEQLAYIHQQIIRAFEWKKGYFMLKEYVDDKKSNLFDDDNMETVINLDVGVKKMGGQTETAEKFIVQLHKILPQTAGEKCNYVQLHSRVASASEWFSKALSEEVMPPLQQLAKDLKRMPRSGKKQKEVYEMLLFFDRKKQQLTQIVEICNRLTQPFSVADIASAMNAPDKKISSIAETVKPAGKPPKGETRRISLQMFKDGKTAQEIAHERGLVQSTIENHLISFIPSGETEVEDFVSDEKLNAILDFYNKNPEAQGTGAAKETLGADFSYTEIRAALKYRQTMEP